MAEIKKSRKGIKALKIILFEIIFIGTTSPIVAFYGPFDRVRYVLVGSSMQTSKHQYIARFFLSDKAIASILDEKKSNVKTKNVDTSKFKASTKIELKELESNKHFKGYVVLVHDPKRVSAGTSSDFGVNAMTVDAMAQSYNAIAAINAGSFNAMGKREVGGYVVSGGKIKVKNVNSDNEKISAMLINKDGKLLVGDYSINDIKRLSISEALCYGPALIIDGKTAPIKDIGSYGIADRTAIGQKADGTIIMLTILGRSASSFGASIKDLQDIMIQYGAVNAYNLDGGGSTHMYYSDQELSLQKDLLRPVPTILYAK